ncbi:MAG: deoxyribonuclease IV [Candidatus Nitrosothermus koennekii]|nr:MAG: deoxyribonuclease IV [Candidatus Nitrosothermus koennekii]
MDLKLGVHVSIAGSIDQAVDRALSLNCTAFQIFTRNPRGWKGKPLDDEEADRFKEKVKKSKININSICVHMPYLPNLASPKEEQYKRSVEVLVDEAKRCEMLGIKYLVIHLGSHLNAGVDVGMRNIVNACIKASEVSKTIILLENMAGQKNSIGSKFDELRRLLDMLDDKNRFGICFDTCHAFAAGYDIRDADKVIEEFDNKVGFENIKIVHLNDSKSDLGLNSDRHEHIGLGYIGEDGFKKILHSKLRQLPLILETPIDKRRDDIGNLNKVKELAK